MHEYKVLVTIFLPLAHIALTGSIYSTLALTLERYTTVCHPFFKVLYSKHFSKTDWIQYSMFQFTFTVPARLYLLPIFILTVTYNIPKFFELQATL